VMGFNGDFMVCKYLCILDLMGFHGYIYIIYRLHGISWDFIVCKYVCILDLMGCHGLYRGI